MADKQWYVICYDVTDAGRWRKIYKRLQGYGTRLQYSIFRCRLTKIEIEKLRWELEKDLTAEDRLLILSVCDRCEQKTLGINRPESWRERDKNFDLV